MQDHAAEIVRRAMQRPSGQREAFVDGACADDPALRAQVLAAIASAQVRLTTPGPPPASGAGSIDSAPTSSISAHAAEAPISRSITASTEGPGTSIGPYKILERIGE